MSGERALDRLLAGMRPELQPGTYLFCTLSPGAPVPDLTALATFREAEGLTLVVEENEAGRRSLAGDFRAAWITLTVHSDLAAVGFLAAVSAALAADGIPCNPISAYHHDHLFVPIEQAQRALAALKRLQRSAGPSGLELDPEAPLVG